MRLAAALHDRLFLLIPLCVLLAGVGLRVADPPLLQELRLRAFDLYQEVSPRESIDQIPVTVVAIDETALEQYGQWPWPRDLLARLVRALQSAGARAVILNLLLAEPDRTSPQLLAESLPAEMGKVLLEAIAAGRLEDPDETLATALSETPSVLGFSFAPRDTASDLPNLRGGFSFIGENPAPYIPNFASAIASLDRLQAAAKGNGAMTLLKDSDGVVRRIPLILGLNGKTYPSLAVEALRVAQNARGLLVKTSGRADAEASGAETGVQAIRIGRKTVPTDPNGELWFFQRQPNPDEWLSAAAVLSGDAAARSALVGSIAIVGATAAGLADLHATPLAPALPGVALQAAVVEQLWTGDHLERPAWTRGAEILAVAAIGLLVLLPFALPRLGALLAGLLGALAVAASVGVSWWAFVSEHLLLDPVTPALVGFAVYASAGISSFTISERRRAKVRSAFGQYVSPAVVEKIAENPEAARLEGETRELSILFCDIRGFTAISEKLPPEDLARLINRFLTRMSKAVLAHQGTIDKYIGDCLMAFWNAPLPVVEHADQACLAVLDMRRRLKKMNQQLRDEGLLSPGEELAVGMGLNSGKCSVGNMGSDFRLAYTAMGDAVNLAARLETITRQYGVDLLVSDATRREVAREGDDLAFLEIDRIRVKGRETPETVFALLGDARTLLEDETFSRLRAQQESFLQAYRARQWSNAEQELQAMEPLAVPFALSPYLEKMRERLGLLQADPPPPDWDGVFTATEK